MGSIGVSRGVARGGGRVSAGVRRGGQDKRDKHLRRVETRSRVRPSPSEGTRTAQEWGGMGTGSLRRGVNIVAQNWAANDEGFRNMFSEMISGCLYDSKSHEQKLTTGYVGVVTMAILNAKTTLANENLNEDKQN